MSDINTTIKRALFHFPLEAVIWLGGLAVLAVFSPGDNTHVSICPLSNLGYNFCPGCGLGRSVSFLLHGHFAESFQAHPLGIFAVIVLSFRIFRLTKLYYTDLWQK